MNKNHDIYSNNEKKESTPEWVSELRKEHREAMLQFNAILVTMKNEWKEINAGLNSLYSEMRSINAEIKSVNAKIESASLKREEAIKELEVLHKMIDETEEFHAETDKYWQDLINEEIRQRYITDHRNVCISKSFRKRLNNNVRTY